MNKKSLQKLTDFESKIKKLFSAKTIKLEDRQRLFVKYEDRKRLAEYMQDKLAGLVGEERDRFIEQIWDIAGEEFRNATWEYNHGKITWAISELMKEGGRMPLKRELVVKTGLSRQTIDKHIKEIQNHPLYQGVLEQHRFMASKVLTRVFDFAVNGDVKACKLYLEMVGGLSPRHQSRVTQNYIQINNTVLSEETLRLLNETQLKQIEEIILQGKFGLTAQ